jgi:hypothetical protein
MCRAVRCRTCEKTTWAGCGQHVAQVRSAVPLDQWCAGHDGDRREPWLRRVLGR